MPNEIELQTPLRGSPRALNPEITLMQSKAKSFKPLTISSESLPASTARQEALTSYAAERAKLLLGCFRTGEANDPVTYVAAVTAILAQYPEEVITSVTHPVTGLPKAKNWLPTVKEVSDACEAAYEPIVQQELRLKRIKEQMEAREREAAGVRPTLEQLHAKYGKDWGMKPADERTKSTFKAPTIEELVQFYRTNPERVARLQGETGE